MAMFLVSAGGHNLPITVNDNAQLAALAAVLAKHNASLKDEDGQPDASHADHCPTTTAYLQWSLGQWASANPGCTAQDLQDTAARALASYAGQNAPAVVVQPEVGPPSQVALLAYAADKRWRVEVAGTSWGGHTVQTDRESQTKLLAAFVQLGAGLRQEGSPWKFSGGFQALSNADMSAVISAALVHVQTAFAVEAALCAGIASGTVRTKSDVDSAAWPT